MQTEVSKSYLTAKSAKKKTQRTQRTDLFLLKNRFSPLRSFFSVLCALCGKKNLSQKKARPPRENPLEITPPQPTM
jgi:hypothetical protein